MSRCWSVVVVVALGLISLAGCSSGGPPNAAGSSETAPAVAAAAPTAPSAAVCGAVRAVTTAAPTIAAGATEVGNDSAYYTQLLLALAENGGSDPASTLVSADAEKVKNDYFTLDSAAQQGDSGAESSALAALGTDLKAMAKDEGAFDRACGIRALVLSTSAPTVLPSIPQDAPSPSQSPTPAAAPEQVTYSCTGSAPDGVNITYGPNGSNHSATSLPFHHTEPLTSGAEYYVTTAQLQGSGSVSCTTTVQTDNFDGTADDVTNTGSADGGYNIASAQVCSDFSTGWTRC